MNDDQHRIAPGRAGLPEVTTDERDVGPVDGARPAEAQDETVFQAARAGSDTGPHDPDALSGDAPAEQASDGQSIRPTRRAKYVFLGAVSAIVLLLDVGSKAWAEMELSARGGANPMVLIPGHLSFNLAYNEGGAWGLLQGADAAIRKPFFLVVSVIAIGFIVSLYRRLAPEQWALRWGLPLVLGGALGNLSDRVVRSGVVDFILYRADWVGGMNRLISRVAPRWTVTDYWPTYNVADIAICAGVGLMAVDMLTSKRPSTDRGEDPRSHVDEDNEPESGPGSHGATPGTNDRHELRSAEDCEHGGAVVQVDGQNATLLTDRR